MVTARFPGFGASSRSEPVLQCECEHVLEKREREYVRVCVCVCACVVGKEHGKAYVHRACVRVSEYPSKAARRLVLKGLLMAKPLSSEERMCKRLSSVSLSSHSLSRKSEGTAA